MKVYNTLSGKKEEFKPHGGEVKMYVCGVTPYDESHIGHAMSYIVFDVIKRYLQFRGYKVKYVQNITDIDDKIIDRANKLGIPASELAGKFADSYFEDMDALNIARADVYPRATEEIPKIIEVIQGLIDKGHAYSAQGSVYFRVGSVPDYGKLAHRSLESVLAEARVEAGEGKEHPMDFALWKAAKPGEPSWESPWGNGRPGWHIECSAMSLKYLGDRLDIHGGGQDLIFPHHENEIAQSEGFTGAKPFVKYWLHNGLLQLGKDKMSKSIGNLITIKEALEKYSADALRIFVLGSHYRSPLTYSEAALQAIEVALVVFRDAKWKLTEPYSGMNRSLLESQGIRTDDITDAKIYYNRFISAMDDDFNTAQALASLFGLAQEINRAVNLGHEDRVVEHREIFRELAGVLGLILPEPEQPIVEHVDIITAGRVESIAATRGEKLRWVIGEIASELENPAGNIDNVRGYINLAAAVRDSLRKEGRFQLADEIRAKLGELGIALEDTPKGTVWRRKR